MGESDTPQPKPDSASLRLQAWDLTATDIAGIDAERLHALSVGVGWPHRVEDWRLLQSVGKGWAALDEIGRVIGSALWFPAGDSLVAIGMAITTPRLQAMGAGGWLMSRIMQACAGRDLRLNATRAGYRLYESLGFRPVMTVVQHQGRAEAPVDPGPAAMIEGSPPEEIFHLDHRAYGADRRAALSALADISRCTVLRAGPEVVGFALCRPFGRGHLIGPVVARDDAEAIDLCRPFLASHAGDFVRVDLVAGQAAVGRFLAAHGLPEFDTVTQMVRGEDIAPREGLRMFALASQALG